MCSFDFANPLRQSTYRPAPSSKTTSNLLFRNLSDNEGATTLDVSGLVDAFTGEALNVALGLYQCAKCGVFYHRSTVEFIRTENNGKCISCQQTSILEVTSSNSRQKWQNVTIEPDVITLDNYQLHVDRVITFRGVVRNILKSTSGKDYALMFEDKTWCDGFKVVIQRGKIKAAGGSRFFYKLKGRTIRVRGLLQHHPIFGFQILVSDRSMIQL